MNAAERNLLQELATKAKALARATNYAGLNEIEAIISRAEILLASAPTEPCIQLGPILHFLESQIKRVKMPVGKFGNDCEITVKLDALSGHCVQLWATTYAPNGAQADSAIWIGTFEPEIE
jgi:hypothetical protein